MCRARNLVAEIVVVSLLAIALAGSSGAAEARSPRVAYTCRYQLCIARSDGSGEVRSVAGVEPTTTIGPRWSPDGTRLVFQCFWDGGALPVRDRIEFDRTGYERNAGGEICTARADGSHLRKLTRTHRTAVAPTWSPDGRRIAFAIATGEPGIFTMSRDGSDVRRLTTGLDDFPAWSPDGSRIVFSRSAANDAPPSGADLRYTGALARLVSVPAAGGEVTALSSPTNGYDLGPAWSRDGSQLAFTRWTYEMRRETWVISADATSARVVLVSPVESVEGPEYDLTPSWSPDDTRLLVSRVSPATSTYEVSLVDLRSATTKVLSPRATSANATGALDPAFTDGGASVVFVFDDYRGRSTNFQVFRVSVDGTRLTQLTDDDREHYGPVAQPIRAA